MLSPKVSAHDHIAGPADAPLILVEYGDYQCPYCGQAYPIVQEIQRRMKGKLCFVFRNFPLANAHPNAELAAEAAEAAGAQGRFWEMHDLLYENQASLEPESLVEYGAGIGLEVGRFTRELNEHVYAPRVKEDFRSGARSGVNGTPTFFINGERHDGPFDLHSLLNALKAARVE